MKNLLLSPKDIEILKIALEEGFGIGKCKGYVEGCPDCRATKIYRKLEKLKNSRRP
ncbi:MAG: hypothetical protein QME59_07085 [Candidatus Hydrothermarchaeota archaeon]|nr:hypothetical protein [Candidatus Hydrothermarchaeota archaeon]